MYVISVPSGRLSSSMLSRIRKPAASANSSSTKLRVASCCRAPSSFSASSSFSSLPSESMPVGSSAGWTVYFFQREDATAPLVSCPFSCLPSTWMVCPSRISVSGIRCSKFAGMVMRAFCISRKSSSPLTRGLDESVSVRYARARNSSALMPSMVSFSGVSCA